MKNPIIKALPIVWDDNTSEMSFGDKVGEVRGIFKKFPIARYELTLNNGKWGGYYPSDDIAFKVHKEKDLAKAECQAHKDGLLQKALDELSDGGKSKAVGDTCFISEIINDLEKEQSRSGSIPEKALTMLNDWRKELMGIAGIETVDEIQAIHADLCGPENWGAIEYGEEE